MLRTIVDASVGAALLAGGVYLALAFWLPALAAIWGTGRTVIALGVVLAGLVPSMLMAIGVMILEQVWRR